MTVESAHDPDVELPADFADHLATVGNLDGIPETLVEYWSTFADHLGANDQTITPEDLYSDPPTRHEVHVDDRIRYSPCVLDALTAAMIEPQQPVTVRSVDPVTGTPVTFTVGDEHLSVTPSDAVVSFGIAATIPRLESTDVSIFEWMLDAERPSISRAFCRFINAFESPATYDRWAEANDGESISIQPAAAAELIRQFIDRP